VTVDSATYAGAADVLDRLIGSQVARFAFGERAEFERSMKNDPTIAAALRLSEGAMSQNEMFTRAQSIEKAVGKGSSGSKR